MTKIAFSRAHFPVSTLGPGRRLAIWFQGCSIRCPGCVSLDTWAAGISRTLVQDLLVHVSSALDEADGITVTGGEPFDQPEALEELLRGIRNRTCADILAYSGYPLETLGPALRTMDGLIDCVISDPFDSATPQTLTLRGSDNQRLVPLTALGRERFAAFDRELAPDDRALDLMFDDEAGAVFLAGIPSRGDMLRLAAVLAKGGHLARTSEDKRSRP